MIEKFSEDRIHSECYCAFHNTYPDFRGLLNYNLNNSMNAVAGRRDKGLGLQKGRSDMVLYMCGTAFMIEMKTPKGKQHGKQPEWEKLITAAGYDYVIMRSVETFMEYIEKIILEHREYLKTIT